MDQPLNAMGQAPVMIDVLSRTMTTAAARHELGQAGAYPTYTVASGTLSKKFTIDVTEVDKGTLGQDDQGQSTLTFDLTPTMTPSTKSAIISLKRPDMSYQGKVKVNLTAQQA